MVVSKAQKITYLLTWVVLGAVFCAMIYFGYDALWPPKIVEFYDSMIPIARDYTKCEDPIQVFHPGDIVPLRFRGYKYTDDIPLIMTKLVNDYKMELRDIAEAKSIGPFDSVGLSRRVPIGAHPGLVYFEISYIYNRNFLRKNEVYRVRSEPFRVEVKKHPHDDEEDRALFRKMFQEEREKRGKGKKKNG